MNIFHLLLILFATTNIRSDAMNVKVPKYLAVYYGWPSLVQNSQGDITLASNWFGQFDLIVFGNGLWDSAHGDHSKTQMIINNLNSNGKKVFGYVDLGVTTENLSITKMKQAVDGWKTMNVYGIFWDDAGYDYGVTRQRQSTMIDYCHSLNLSVILNAWNPDDVLAGNDVRVNNKDIYLLESYLISNGAYQSLSDWKIKADKCANYQKTLGVQMACLSSTNTDDQYLQAWFGTAMYNFDYFQSTDIFYSSTNNNLSFRANPSSSYGTIWQSANVSSNPPQTYFSRSTESWTLIVTGDGRNWGYGTFQRV